MSHQEFPSSDPLSAEAHSNIDELSCGVVVFNPMNQVLVIQHLAGHWSFPKGHKEAGESDPETACRELQEETGLKEPEVEILSDASYSTHYQPKPGHKKEVRYFIGRFSPASPSVPVRIQAEELQNYAWLPFPEAMDRLTFAEDKMLLQELFPLYLNMRVNLPDFSPAELLANTARPAPADLPLAQVETPAFVIDTRLLEDHMRLLQALQKQTGCQILLAQKSFSCYGTYPLLGRYLQGTCSSGLHEALLGSEEMPDHQVHVFSPAYKPEEITALLPIADHLIFNSFSQWNRYKEQILTYNQTQKAQGMHRVSCGLRLNPQFSQVEHDLYNPAAPGSRLGIPLEVFRQGVQTYGLDGIEGLHFHTLCEENANALDATWQVVKQNFSPWLHQMKWINMGGGHHITREDYNLELLRQIVRDARDSYQVQVFLEPGEACTLNCGWLVSQVQDLLYNDMNLAIVDTSATCHMPDTLEMPYTPKLFLLSKDGRYLPTQESKDFSNPLHYRLGGPTCLAGDVIGDYLLPRPLEIGDTLVFCDMALYTMVKTNTFNGMPLPSIYFFGNQGLKLEKKFGYEDFKSRLGS